MLFEFCMFLACGMRQQHKQFVLLREKSEHFQHQEYITI